MDPYAAPKTEPQENQSRWRWSALVLALCVFAAGLLYFQSLAFRRSKVLAEKARLEAQQKQAKLANEALKRAEAAE